MFCWSCTRAKKSYVYKKNRKVVIVGDSGCGKSCLMRAMAGEQWSDENLENSFDSHGIDIEINKQKFELMLFDTPADEAFDRLRPLVYPCSDIILICFAIDSPDSLKNVVEKWMPECKHFCGSLVPIVLVGNKKDLRDGKKPTEEFVHSNEGHKMARKIGAAHYLECSANTGEGIREVSEYAACYTMFKQQSR